MAAKVGIQDICSADKENFCQKKLNTVTHLKNHIRIKHLHKQLTSVKSATGISLKPPPSGGTWSNMTRGTQVHLWEVQEGVDLPEQARGPHAVPHEW